ncbi:hypothetical protein ACFY7C_19215 [Streptomyces sp. NPDC012769]|uniref:hypothetical protein n=1 Tax=Streptomyces sp. NPDC012769 TaxID=3364848 RepID=UPI0036C09969
MKEPTEHRPGDGEYPEYCEHDQEPWPCAKWQKWTASKDYRIQELELKVSVHGNTIRAHTARHRETEEKLRRLELLIRGGVLRALADVGMGRITEEVTRDYIDAPIMGGEVVRFARAEDYTVTYAGPNKTYVNNELTEDFTPGRAP